MQSDWSTQPDSQVIVKWLPSNYNIFFSKSRLSKWIAIMNDDIGKFGYDSMQQGRKKYEKYLTENLSFKVKFLTCIVPNNIHEKIPVIGHLPPMRWGALAPNAPGSAASTFKKGTNQNHRALPSLPTCNAT